MRTTTLAARLGLNLLPVPLFLVAVFGLSIALLPSRTNAFCGFYVAQADAKLFNKSSQVILVRDGNQTVVTMANDFQGEVKDFAIVIPVPEVLKRDQIQISEMALFEKLDRYSGPRLVEYHDQNPCYRYEMMQKSMAGGAMDLPMSAAPPEQEMTRNLGVKIEAVYDVEEYQILILSAKESNGLKIWLTQNGYKIPDKAEEVLEPYVKSGMKFFVVKVNLEKYKALNPNGFQDGVANLRPIQIRYSSEKFMLPIRLGMANSNGTQDLIVYAFSRKGRIETANYPTREIPTNTGIPLRIKDNFGEFYSTLFTKAWERGGENSVLLEYFWDLSGKNFTKCDPCATTPPAYAELKKAGVDWLQAVNKTGWRGSDYDGDVYMTRLHARYSRPLYPEDFVFHETNNRKNFQGRYVMHHLAQGDLSCAEGQSYIFKRAERQKQWEVNLTYLTGWKSGILKEKDYQEIQPEGDNMNATDGWFLLGAGGGNGPNGPNLDPTALDWTRWLLAGTALAALLALLVVRHRRRLAAVRS